MTLDQKALAAALLPCPFCDGEATLINGAAQYYRIECRNPDCFGPITSWYGDISDATFAWNRRAALPFPEPVATEQQIEDRLLSEEAADNLRLIDWISDRIGLPENEELTSENYLRYASPPSHQGLREAEDWKSLAALHSRRAALFEEFLRRILTHPANGTNDKGQAFGPEWAFYQVHQLAVQALTVAAPQFQSSGETK